MVRSPVAHTLFITFVKFKILVGLIVGLLYGFP